MPSITPIPNFQGKKKKTTQAHARTRTHAHTHRGYLAWCSSIKPINGFCIPLPLQDILTREKISGLRRLNPSKEVLARFRILTQYSF